MNLATIASEIACKRIMQDQILAKRFLNKGPKLVKERTTVAIGTLFPVARAFQATCTNGEVGTVQKSATHDLLALAEPSWSAFVGIMQLVVY